MGHIQLGDLVDSGVFQEILENFSKVTSMAAVAVNYRGEPLTKYANFTDFCSELRKDNRCRSCCYKSDAHGGVEAARSGKPYIYKCHTGLTDIAVPIIENGQYLGAILAGQVKVSDFDYPEIQRSNDPFLKEKLDDPKLVSLFEEIPIITKEQLENASDLLYLMANYIVEKAMRSHVQEELNEKNERIIVYMKQRMELEKNLRESELKLLQSQVNPHFLFNVLNTIHSLAMIESSPKTSEMVCNLSEMLRYTIQNKMQNLVTLEEELEYTKKYISIQEARIGDMIRFQIDIPEDHKHIKMPFMTLQPFVSNAINHGIYGFRDNGHIKISSEFYKEHLIVHVEDDGVGIGKNTLENILEGKMKEKDSKSTGIGIRNTNRRLEHLFGSEFKLNIKSSQGVGTRVSIKLPK